MKVRSDKTHTTSYLSASVSVSVSVSVSLSVCGDSAQTDAVTDVGNTAETEMLCSPHRY